MIIYDTVLPEAKSVLLTYDFTAILFAGYKQHIHGNWNTTFTYFKKQAEVEAKEKDKVKAEAKVKGKDEGITILKEV